MVTNNSKALKSIASGIADKYLQQYIREGTNNSFIPLMKADIRRTILRKALKCQE